MALLFQMEDDYIDVWGDTKKTGKIGTDITDGKCSWVIITALKFCSEEDKNLLRKHYGNKTDESDSIVRILFDKLNIKNLFKNEKIRIIENIKREIDDFRRNQFPLNTEIFVNILNKINFHFGNE